MAPIVGYLLLPLVPTLVRRISGGLRTIVLVSVVVAGTRGILFSLLAIAVAAGALSPTGAGVAIIAIVVIAGSLDNVSSQLQLTWVHLVLSEHDRRVAIQIMATLSTLVPGILLAVGSLVVVGTSVRSFVPLFLVGTGASAVMILSLVRLPSPGKTKISSSGMSLLRSPIPVALRPLVLAQTASGLAHGLCPFMGIYAFTVLGMSPAFAVLLAAMTTIASFVTTPLIARHLIGHSASRLLRFSYLIRVVGMGLVLCSLPGLASAPSTVVLGAILVAVGNQAGGMATNERLFRVCRGSEALLQQGRLVAYPAFAMIVGQVIMALVLLGGASYLAFAGLIGGGALLRLVSMKITHGEDEPVCDDPEPEDLDEPALEADRRLWVPA